MMLELLTIVNAELPASTIMIAPKEESSTNSERKTQINLTASNSTNQSLIAKDKTARTPTNSNQNKHRRANLRRDPLVDTTPQQ